MSDDFSDPSLTLSAQATAVGLGQGISAACGLQNPSDWVSFGATSGCMMLVNGSGAPNTGYRRADLRGCVDTDTSQDWLLLTNPMPRRLMSPADVCLCP